MTYLRPESGRWCFINSLYRQATLHVRHIGWTCLSRRHRYGCRLYFVRAHRCGPGRPRNRRTPRAKYRRLAIDAGYGFGLPGNRGVLTPCAGLTLGDAGSRTVRRTSCRGGHGPAFGGGVSQWCGCTVRVACAGTLSTLLPLFLFVLSGLFANRDQSRCAAYLTEILPPVHGDGV